MPARRAAVNAAATLAVLARHRRVANSGAVIPTIILASASPRRHELLARSGIHFEVMHPAVGEIHDASIAPDRLCEINATIKAEAVAAMRPDAVVIGADTLVFIDGEPLGKPADCHEARTMLRRLAGRVHMVCTGVCVIFPDGGRKVFHDTTAVTFHPLDDAAIEDYLTLANPLDKAGAYGIQEHGDRIVAGIHGSFDNVMGLPVEKVMAALALVANPSSPAAIASPQP
jgi:septum formation protein